jgi:hypothetical protein
MGERPFVVEDLTEIAGIDPHAALRASVKIRSFLWRWLVLVARHVVHGRKNPRANAQVSIARMPAAQSNASKTPASRTLSGRFHTRRRDALAAGTSSIIRLATTSRDRREPQVQGPRRPFRMRPRRRACSPDRPFQAASIIGTRVHCRRQLEQEGFERVANAPGSWTAR